MFPWTVVGGFGYPAANKVSENIAKPKKGPSMLIQGGIRTTIPLTSNYGTSNCLKFKVFYVDYKQMAALLISCDALWEILLEWK